MKKNKSVVLVGTDKIIAALYAHDRAMKEINDFVGKILEGPDAPDDMSISLMDVQAMADNATRHANTILGIEAEDED